MFLTITIDTTRSKKVKMARSQIVPTSGWRKALNAKKRTMWIRIKSWRKDKIAEAAVKDGVLF